MTILIVARIGSLVLGFGLFSAHAIALPAETPRTGTNADRHAAVAPTTVKSRGRFEFYMREALPANYRGRTNPYQPTIPLVIKGADRYNARCASCHGLMGFGNGQASGGAARPRPADLAGSLSSPDTKDDYLFWTISEGGAQFRSSMPAFKKPDLSDGEIWEIITYMRAAFEGREARATTTHDGAQHAAREDPR
jgi:mono/diheme cytochrome c family protein